MTLHASEFLRTVPMLSALSQPEFEEVLACVTETVSLAPGEQLFERGEEGDGVYVVESGQLDVVVLADNIEVQVARIGVRELVGELAFLDGFQRSATIRARVESRLYRIESSKFEVLRRELRPSAAKVIRSVSRTLCARLRETNERIAQAIMGQASSSLGPTLTSDPRGRPSKQAFSTPVRAVIEQLAVFEYLTSAERDTISKHLTLCGLDRDVEVFAEGEAATSCLLVVSGEIGVYKQLYDGTEERIAMLGCGALVGHIALIDRANRSATCRVESERAVFVEFRKIEFDRLFFANNTFAFKIFYQIIADLAARLRSATEGLTTAKRVQSRAAQIAIAKADVHLGSPVFSFGNVA